MLLFRRAYLFDKLVCCHVLCGQMNFGKLFIFSEVVGWGRMESDRVGRCLAGCIWCGPMRKYVVGCGPMRWIVIPMCLYITGMCSVKTVYSIYLKCWKEEQQWSRPSHVTLSAFSNTLRTKSQLVLLWAKTMQINHNPNFMALIYIALLCYR